MNDDDVEEDYFPEEAFEEAQIRNDELDPNSLRHKAIRALGTGNYEAIRSLIQTRPNLTHGVFPKLLFLAATHDPDVDWHVTFQRNPKRKGNGNLRSDEVKMIRRDFRVFCFLLHEEAYKHGNAQCAIPHAASHFGMSISVVAKIWDSLRKSDNLIYSSLLESHKHGDSMTVGIAEALAFNRLSD